MDYSKPKIGDLIYSDADIFFTSGSISRRYKVVEICDDKIHFVNDTGYYTDIKEGYIDIKYVEPFKGKIIYPTDCRYFDIPLEVSKNNMSNELN